MCGRYYVDHQTAGEIEKLVRQLNEKMKNKAAADCLKLTAKDIHPTEAAPVLAASNHVLSCQWQHWGFPGFQKKQVIFNARCESVMEKPTFRESILHRRVVIPGAWFYEWNRKKEKNIFYRKEQPVLFMAGCCKTYEDGDHFVILTTAANASMQPVHDRMPLLLEREEVADWILDSSKMEQLLYKTPCLLERRMEYEQMSLF